MEREHHSKFDREFCDIKLLKRSELSSVFRARNKLDGAMYAIKRISFESLNESMRQEDLKYALREIRALAQLDHPGLIRYNCAWSEGRTADEESDNDDEIGDNIYIQMQLCSCSLADWLAINQDETSRSLLKLMSWFKQLLSTVAYVHKEGIIHRDLKPSNILIREKEGNLKVSDFGVQAHRKIVNGEEITCTRTECMGSSDYMAPEQENISSTYTSKVDVFALGMVFAELCVPMTAEKRLKEFQYVRRGTPEKLNADPVATAIIRMLTRKEPKERATCREILEHPLLAMKFIHQA